MSYEPNETDRSAALDGFATAFMAAVSECKDNQLDRASWRRYYDRNIAFDVARANWYGPSTGWNTLVARINPTLIKLEEAVSR